ncbi:MAG: tetraacyldisaccharide 4'-kinase [Gammaproteobacteria bacterium]|nr:tetraacyldisaccharide 4'-kinase [Gammaproteobacteria bacterium]
MLAPLGWLTALGALVRRRLYLLRVLPSKRLAVPVLVIGNLTVGGTGKTPLTILIANRLKQRGYRPGIVCSGYKGRASAWPQQVRPDSDPIMVGDESVLLARRTGCPVAASPRRAAAADALTSHVDCNVVLSDDGLQHLALARDIEIAVLDGVRRLGNGRCLPAGPLREPRGRLADVDFVVVNGDAGTGEIPMRMELGDPVNIVTPGARRPLSAFKGPPVHAVCGVGHPERFFQQLEKAGLEIIRHPFPDHHEFTAGDIGFDDGQPVLMTEKDAVKCVRFAAEEHWFVPADATVPESFFDDLFALLEHHLDHIRFDGP